MHKKFLVISLFIAGLFLLVQMAGAQEEMHAEFTVGDQVYTVGDAVDLTLAVTHPTGFYVITPALEESWGDFIVKSITPATAVDNGDGSTTTTINIDARLFVPGESNTPPLPVTVTDGAGQLHEIIASPATIAVQSVLIPEDNTLRDIKPQAELPFLNVLPWLSSALLVTLSLIVVALWWKRRQAQLALAAIDNRLPHEIALDELTRIEGLDLAGNGRCKEHYTLVSDTVRIYIEKRFGISMLERTTAEIRESLRQSDMRQADRQQLITFLDESDLIKFSTFKPDVASAKQLVRQARQIINVTKPQMVTVQDSDNKIETLVSPPQPTTFSTNGKMSNAEVST